MKNLGILLFAIIQLGYGQSNLTSTPEKLFFNNTFPFEFKDGKIIINIDINGEKYPFILDTGAPCAISKKLQDKYLFPTIANAPIIDAYNNVASISLVKISSLNINQLKFNNVTAMVTIPEFLECIGTEGIIGYNLLKDCTMQISFNNKTITITDTIDKINTKEYKAFEMTQDYYHVPFIKVEISKGFYDDVIFDTGGEDFFTMSNSAFEKYLKTNKPLKIINGKGASNFGTNGIEKSGNKKRIKIDKINFCEKIFKDVYTDPADFPNSRFGVYVLRYGDVIIDYKASKFYFKTYSNRPKIISKPVNLSLTYINGKYVVGTAWDNLVNKVDFGDEVLEVDGQAKVFNNYCEFFTVKSINWKKNKHKVLVKTKSNECKKVVMKYLK